MGDRLGLSVEDAGAGMQEEEVRKRIFEPFFTTKPDGEGTGLGLSMAFGIVKSNKGNITVNSEQGRGSIFKVYLPTVDTGVSVRTEAPQHIPGGNERMLRVDDEEMIVESVWYKLRRLGDEVTAITDSQEALKQRSSWSAQSHLADEVQVQLAGDPPSLFARRNFRPEFLVQGIGLFR